MENTTEVDFSKVNWNKLTPQEFHALEKQLKESTKQNRKAAKKFVSNKKVIVAIDGSNYQIPETLLQQVKNSDPEVKKLLVEDIKNTFIPIMKI